MHGVYNKQSNTKLEGSVGPTKKILLSNITNLRVHVESITNIGTVVQKEEYIYVLTIFNLPKC